MLWSAAVSAAFGPAKLSVPIMFVTARIVTPAGLPLNGEEEEGLLPPDLPEVPAYKK